MKRLAVGLWLTLISWMNRLLDGEDNQVLPSAVVEFRAGVRTCSPAVTQHVRSLLHQGLAWDVRFIDVQEASWSFNDSSPRLSCVSDFNPEGSGDRWVQAATETTKQGWSEFWAHETMWADPESFAAVMAFANYRRFLRKLGR
jgi:hypothetical protein